MSVASISSSDQSMSRILGLCSQIYIPLSSELERMGRWVRLGSGGRKKMQWKEEEKIWLRRVEVNWRLWREEEESALHQLLTPVDPIQMAFTFSFAGFPSVTLDRFRFRGLPYILFIFFQAELLCHDEQFSKFLCWGCLLSIQIYSNSYTALSRCHPLEPEVASPRKISVPETRMQTPEPCKFMPCYWLNLVNLVVVAQPYRRSLLHERGNGTFLKVNIRNDVRP
jgi:hypothetical protein